LLLGIENSRKNLSRRREEEYTEGSIWN